MFTLSPRIFTAVPDEEIGVLSVVGPADKTITNAAIDSDLPEIYNRFVTEYEPAIGGLDGAWYIKWIGGEMASGVEYFDIPVYIEYTASTGIRGNWKGTFTVCAKGLYVQKPSIQYVENIASRVGTVTHVTIFGHNFNNNLVVFLGRPDGKCIAVSGDKVTRNYGDANGYDSMSFVFDQNIVAMDSKCDEMCGLYTLNIGYGDCDANSIETGTNDDSNAWNNNIYLIRYRYDADNSTITAQNPGGLMKTVDSTCFYSTDIEVITDDYGSTSKHPASGGVSGPLDTNIHFRIPPGADCTKMGYYRVRMKYSHDLPKKYGELLLDGLQLSAGELVWLDNQFDGGDGLWIVQPGDWIGLKTYLAGNISTVGEEPCNKVKQEPLPVDENVIADLGVHVKDTVSVACDSDFPEKDMYGSQFVCGQAVHPGDSVLLSNQVNGENNGIWEVTCAEWIQRSRSVPPHNGNAVSGDDYVIVQNDIDFCACDRNNKNIFHIWYYYLNGSCFLARATRTVKIICGAKGSLFPSNGVDVSDYAIAAEANSDLVSDTQRTAGDPVAETCTKEVENYDAGHRANTTDTSSGCSSETIVAPNGLPVCRCNHQYGIDPGITFNSRDRNGFSIVFWQLGDDMKWHLYAYIGAGRYDLGMRYYVYHICTAGIATDADVDENAECIIPGTDVETRDAWFSVHGGKLADGFGLFDDTWNFKVVHEDKDGDEEVEYTHVLNADTLYSSWSIKNTTTMCAVKVYGDNEYEIIPTPDTWGFKFYDEAISKYRLCTIWNSIQH